MHACKWAQGSGIVQADVAKRDVLGGQPKALVVRMGTVESKSVGNWYSYTQIRGRATRVLHWDSQTRRSRIVCECFGGEVVSAPPFPFAGIKSDVSDSSLFWTAASDSRSDTWGIVVKK